MDTANVSFLTQCTAVDRRELYAKRVGYLTMLKRRRNVDGVKNSELLITARMDKYHKVGIDDLSSELYESLR